MEADTPEFNSKFLHLLAIFTFLDLFLYSDQYYDKAWAVTDPPLNQMSLRVFLWPPLATVFSTEQESVETWGQTHTSSRPHSFYLKLQNSLYLDPCFQDLEKSRHQAYPPKDTRSKGSHLWELEGDKKHVDRVWTCEEVKREEGRGKRCSIYVFF